MKIRKIAALVLAMMLLCSGAFALYVEDWWIEDHSTGASKLYYDSTDKYVPGKARLVLECYDAGYTENESATASLNSASYIQFIPVDSKGEFAVATAADGDIRLNSYDLNTLWQNGEELQHRSMFEIHVDYDLKPGKYEIQFVDPTAIPFRSTFGGESGLYNGNYSEVCIDVNANPEKISLFIDDVANQYGKITIEVASTVSTGDGANLMLWAAATLVGAAGVVMMSRKRREA